MSALPDFQVPPLPEELELPLGLLEASLDNWIDSFPAGEIRQHLAELERRKGTIEAAIEALNRRLQVWATMRTFAAGHDPAAVRPSKRDAVLNLLEQDPYREFALSEIREALIAGGLLDDTPKARHALEMTVVNMTKRREIERIKKGFYRIARPSAPQSRGDGV